ncbi:Primary amine oxidase [Camellia lanceoleosa]|uniref:Primary amine oxidase n=1 Tax=Camellia lanceoleosa TaxID=1840588 RepID=A0ACC0FLM8_9ERIC|nr:Primary amine oxidase [Camellia lanceoleosa]
MEKEVAAEWETGQCQCQAQMQVWTTCMKLDSKTAIVDVWWIPPDMQHNLKVVENDIDEERMEVLSTLREVIIVNGELKDMTMKSRKQYRDMAMVVERVGRKLNYAFVFFVLFCSKPNPWCTFNSRRVQARLGSVLETKVTTTTNLLSATPLHPLDPLTVREINTVRAILSSYEPFSWSFPAIHSPSLDEPEKNQVLEWKKSDPIPPRKASVIGLLNGQTHVLTVDLDSGRVISHITNQGSGYPTLSTEDISVALQVIASNEEFNKSIIARGVDYSGVSCITPSVGWFGPNEEGRRLMKAQCYSSQGTANFYMRPIEGLTVMVDIDRKEVVKISNTNQDIPIPKGTNTDYRYTDQDKVLEVEPLNPISMEQPLGSSFRVEDGHVLKWANWAFHLKPDQRVGMIISQAKVQESETGDRKSVMYKGFASEMFVPYMDPRVVIREARPKVALVARMAASVGNYDYIFDWEFQTDGLIRIKVGLSGMLMVKGSSYENMHAMPNTNDTSRPFLSENVIGVVHDHFITFHLDMDIDGPDNSFVKVDLVKEETLPGQSPRKSYLKAKRHVAKTEDEARIMLKLYDPSEFHLVNPSKMSRLGNPSGYKVVPGGTAGSLLDLNDPPQIRAAFTNNQWAGGLLVYQSRGEGTLAVWSERNREIEKKDIVLWYTLGFHHIPCQEDYPIMPTLSSSFDLKPINFFPSNPILRAKPIFDQDLPVCWPTTSS